MLLYVTYFAQLKDWTIPTLINISDVDCDWVKRAPGQRQWRWQTRFRLTSTISRFLRCDLFYVEAELTNFYRKLQAKGQKKDVAFPDRSLPITVW